MARKEARIFTGLWGSDKWRGLSADAQWLYFFLISQPDLAHDGVISLRPRRWVRTARNLSVKDIGVRLDELERAGYLVIDRDTEEVLVRSFMRHDQVFLQPNLMASALAHLPGVESRRVRRAIYAEVSRIIRENSDRVRRADELAPLTEKQKLPIRQMITLLRASGDAELAIEGPRVQSTELPPEAPPEGSAAPTAGGDESGHSSTPAVGDELGQKRVPRPSHGTRPLVIACANNDPVGVEETPSNGASHPPVDPHLVIACANNDPKTSHETRPLTPPPWPSRVTGDDPRSPAGLNPSPEGSANPLGDRVFVTVVSKRAPIPLLLTPNPLPPIVPHGDQLQDFDDRPEFGDDLFSGLPAEPGTEPEDPILADFGTTVPPKDRAAGANTAFERFWAVYPVKIKKGYARQCWDRAVKRATPETIIAGARRYADDPNRHPSYTAHPSSWLNADRWHDEPLPPRTDGNGHRSAAHGALDAAARRRAANGDTRHPAGEITRG